MHGVCELDIEPTVLCMRKKRFFRNKLEPLVARDRSIIGSAEVGDCPS